MGKNKFIQEMRQISGFEQLTDDAILELKVRLEEEFRGTMTYPEIITYCKEGQTTFEKLQQAEEIFRVGLKGDTQIAHPVGATLPEGASSGSRIHTAHGRPTERDAIRHVSGPERE